MKIKVSKLITEKVSDMGLSKKAIEQLVNHVAEGLDDEADDAEITKAVEMVIPFAKMMQAEVTRKTKPAAKPQSNEPSKTEGSEGEKGNNEMPEWAKAFQTQLANLQKENETLKAERTQAERKSLISQKANELGIPKYLMSRFHIADDEDIDKVLKEYKQELVNNNLMPKASASETATSEEEMQAAAKAWAQSLPDAAK